MAFDLPPAQVNVSVQSTDNNVAETSAKNKLQLLYPGYVFTLIRSEIINDKWTGLFSITHDNPEGNKISSDSMNEQDSYNQKMSVPKIIVIILDHNKGILKPFPHNTPAIIPLKLDDEDKNLIHWDGVLEGKKSIVNNELSFKYRTSTFAIWDTDKHVLTINQGQHIKQCELDDNKNEESEDHNNLNNSSFAPSREDIISCIQDE